MLAMKAIVQALDPLDERTAARVLGWAEARYGIEATELAVSRWNETLLGSLRKTAESLNIVQGEARKLDMDPNHLRAALNRLYDEAAAAGSNGDGA